MVQLFSVSDEFTEVVRESRALEKLLEENMENLSADAPENLSVDLLEELAMLRSFINNTSDIMARHATIQTFNREKFESVSVTSNNVDAFKLIMVARVDKDLTLRDFVGEATRSFRSIHRCSIKRVNLGELNHNTLSMRDVIIDVIESMTYKPSRRYEDVPRDRAQLMETLKFLRSSVLLQNHHEDVANMYEKRYNVKV